MFSLNINDVWYHSKYYKKPFVVTGEYNDTPKHLIGKDEYLYSGFILTQKETKKQIKVPCTIVDNAFHRIWSRTKKGAVKNKIDALEREILQLKVTHGLAL